MFFRNEGDKDLQGKTLHWTKERFPNNKTLHLTELGKKKERTNSCEVRRRKERKIRVEKVMKEMKIILKHQSN